MDNSGGIATFFPGLSDRRLNIYSPSLLDILGEVTTEETDTEVICLVNGIEVKREDKHIVESEAEADALEADE